jgi:hypothetical protein
MSKKRVYNKGGRGRPVSAPQPGQGKIVQAYLEPELAQKFFEYCAQLGKGPSVVIPQALKKLFA